MPMYHFHFTLPKFSSVTSHKPPETKSDVGEFLFYLDKFSSVTCHRPPDTKSDGTIVEVYFPRF